MDKSGPGVSTGAEQVLTRDRKWIERLLTATEDDKKDAAILHEMLWLLNIHPKLPGLVQVFRHISEIGKILVECPETDTLRAQIASWTPLLDMVALNSKKLAIQLFPDGEADWEQNRKRFLRPDKPNPLVRHGITRFGLPGALWASHPRPHLQKQFRVIQGRVLDAHLAIIRRESTFVGWQRGIMPSDSFEDGQYRSTWAVRRLATDAELFRAHLSRIKPESTRLELIEALNKIADSFIHFNRPEPDENSPDWLVRRIETQQREEDACESALRSIASFLDWSIHPDQRKKRSGGGGGSHGGVSTLRVVEGGAGDEGENGGDQDPFIESPRSGAGRSNRRSGVHLPNRWRNRSAKYKAAIQAGDHPGESFASQPQALSDDSAGAAFARAGGIEISNQLLPWSFSEMSIAEMAEVLVQLNHLAASGDLESVELLALVKTVLWTGSSLKRAQSLVIGPDIASNESAAVFLQTKPGTALFSLAGAEWKVRPLELEFKSTDFDSRRARRLAKPNLMILPAPQSATDEIERFLQLTPQPNDVNTVQAGPPGDLVRPFEKSSGAYEAILTRAFADSPLDVSFGRISKLLFRRIYQQTGGDIVAAALITGTDHYLASVRRHYCTPRIDHLQVIYRRAATSMATELSKHSPSLGTEIFPQVTPNSLSIGSPICPTDHSLAKAFSEIGLAIRRLKNAPWDRADKNFQDRHNLYTFYTVLCFSIAAAMRGVRTPYLHTTQVDDETGCAVITDKDSGSGYKSRLVWLPEPVRKQMSLYENYLAAISERLRLRESTKEMPCYFLDDSGEMEEVRPTSLAPRLKQYLYLPANAARHWTCTHLREKEDSVSRESIDALLGHWWRGEEPWGTFSSFSYREFRQEIERPIEKIYEELRFRPLSIQKRRGDAR